MAVCKAQASTHCSAVNLLIASSCEMISKEQKEHFYVRELFSIDAAALQLIIAKARGSDQQRAQERNSTCESYLFQFE